MIYGASAGETKKSLRSYVLGFLEVDARPIRDFEKASRDSLKRKRDKGWADKWTYGIPVRRAWRTKEKMIISRIATNSYRSEAGQALAVHGAELDSEEISQALKITVQEVNVYGEPPVTEAECPTTLFSEVFYPSRAVPGGFGERTSNYLDGQTFLYLARYDGDGHALVGKKKPFGDKDVALKIGISNDLDRRCDELNAGIPPAATGRWKLRVRSQPFPDRASAERAESQFKERSAGRLESLGREFFWGSLEEAESLCWSLPGMSRF